MLRKRPVCVTRCWKFTRKNLGMTVICDDNMMIEGIFTDGDLRRVFDMGVDVRQLSIADVMTPGGIRVRPGILARRGTELNAVPPYHLRDGCRWRPFTRCVTYA